MSVLIGPDVGTSGARAVAIDDGGEVLADASSDYPLSSPHPGWSEQDPEDWWEATKEVLGKTAAGSNGEIVGIGLTGQMQDHAPPDGAGQESLAQPQRAER